VAISLAPAAVDSVHTVMKEMPNSANQIDSSPDEIPISPSSLTPFVTQSSSHINSPSNFDDGTDFSVPLLQQQQQQQPNETSAASKTAQISVNGNHTDVKSAFNYASHVPEAEINGHHILETEMSKDKLDEQKSQSHDTDISSVEVDFIDKVITNCDVIEQPNQLQHQSTIETVRKDGKYFIETVMNEENRIQVG
jgi:hypothetical protein